MDKVTQQNAASAEEASSAASELNGQAEELASMVGEFQLERRGARGGKARPALHAPRRRTARSLRAGRGAGSAPVEPPASAALAARRRRLEGAAP